MARKAIRRHKRGSYTIDLLETTRQVKAGTLPVRDRRIIEPDHGRSSPDDRSAYRKTESDQHGADPSMNDELARCDREIARIYREAYAGNPDINGMLLGLHDWRTEKKLIAASTRTSHPVKVAMFLDATITSHPNSQPSLNSTTKDQDES